MAISPMRKKLTYLGGRLERPSTHKNPSRPSFPVPLWNSPPGRYRLPSECTTVLTKFLIPQARSPRLEMLGVRLVAVSLKEKIPRKLFSVR